MTAAGSGSDIQKCARVFCQCSASVSNSTMDSCCKNRPNGTNRDARREPEGEKMELVTGHADWKLAHQLSHDHSDNGGDVIFEINGTLIILFFMRQSNHLSVRATSLRQNSLFVTTMRRKPVISCQLHTISCPLRPSHRHILNKNKLKRSFDVKSKTIGLTSHQFTNRLSL